MTFISAVRGCALACCFSAVGAFGQQGVSPQAPTGDSTAPGQSQSLGDVARRVRKDTTTEIKMTPEDTKKLFESVDKIFAFASEDSGFPKKATVKRQLVGPADVEKFTRGRLAKEEYTQRFAQAEMTMKKFGLLPRDFNLREFLVKANGKNVAGYYDEETKSISLLNWIPLEKQEPILAHELTHALQDQNFGLKTWMKAGEEAQQTGDSKKPYEDNNDDSSSARHAVVEGQAMVVFMDYLLAPVHRSVQDTPGLIYQMEEPAVQATIDSEMMHNAPMILREAGAFAYREGLIFEGELLAKGGKKMAFAGGFARPPRNTHEVIQPQAYIDHEKPAMVAIPDVRQLLSDQYEVYDSGGMGELDVRALMRQYGGRRVAEELSTSWQGGAYVTFRRTSKAEAAISPATGDLALLYVSHWKTEQAAERFAHFYAGAVSQRYQKVTPQPAETCPANQCPLSAGEFLTEEGPVIVEHWSDNTVIVSESFDQATAAKLRSAIRENSADVHAGTLPHDELTLRLTDLPDFVGFQVGIGEKILAEIAKRASR